MCTDYLTLSALMWVRAVVQRCGPPVWSTLVVTLLAITHWCASGCGGATRKLMDLAIYI